MKVVLQAYKHIHKRVYFVIVIVAQLSKKRASACFCFVLFCFLWSTNSKGLFLSHTHTQAQAQAQNNANQMDRKNNFHLNCFSSHSPNALEPNASSICFLSVFLLLFLFLFVLAAFQFAIRLSSGARRNPLRPTGGALDLPVRLC